MASSLLVAPKQQLFSTLSRSGSSRIAHSRAFGGVILSIEIQGVQFSGFPGRDFNDLQRLDFQGRIQWVRYRFDKFFMDTFDRIVAMENDSYVWLCVVNLLTSAVEALSQFEFNDASGMTRFSRFVERYFDPGFVAPVHLDEPPG